MTTNTINFLDQNILELINNHSSIKTLDAAIFAASNIDWNHNDFETRKILAYLITNAQKKALAKTKPMDCPFKLASLFMAKKDARYYYLNGIYSTGAHLVASNGHILINIDHKCEAGFYDALGHKTEMNAKYPDYKVMGSFNRDCQVTLANDSLKFYDSKIKSFTYKKIHQFNSTYVYLLTKKLGLKHGYLCTNKNGDDDILFFESGDKSKLSFVGCIMPLRVPNES